MRIQGIHNFTVLCFLLSLAKSVLVQAQEYQEYQDYADGYANQDNLYANYAAKQSAGDRDAAKGKGGGGFLKLCALSATSWFLGGKIHSTRTLKKLKTKHMKDQKKLYSQYYNDVYKLQQQNAELQYVAEQYKDALTQVQTEWENDKLQRDWEEFSQPDVDGDEKISRAEFNQYVKNYLANYPGLTEKDYPKFEDFDHDGDGYISFQEYAQQMALTVQQAEKEKAAKVNY